MSTRLALALGVLVSLLPLACKDDETCDVEFPFEANDDFDFDAEVCLFVDLVDDCLRENFDDVEGLSDEDLQSEIDSCAEPIEVCDLKNPNMKDALTSSAFDEIRGNSNDCVG